MTKVLRIDKIEKFIQKSKKRKKKQKVRALKNFVFFLGGGLDPPAAYIRSILINLF